jgi:GxxExxY protein
MLWLHIFAEYLLFLLCFQYVTAIMLDYLGGRSVEKVYENALLVELKHRGIEVESQVPIKVSYKGSTVGEYITDLLVEKKVIVELKTVERLDRIHEAQLLNYLKATGIQVGLLVNFKHQKATIKRMVLELPERHDAYQAVKSTG